MSGAERAIAPLVLLPAALRPVVDVLEILAAPGMPSTVVIGGMGVNIRLSTSSDTHRATQDIDVVADNDSPTALETHTFTISSGATGVVAKGDLQKIARIFSACSAAEKQAIDRAIRPMISRSWRRVTVDGLTTILNGR